MYALVILMFWVEGRDCERLRHLLTIVEPESRIGAQVHVTTELESLC